jgi:prevent-host-death family protein
MNFGGVLMNIRPSAAIRQNYNEIADLCRRTGEPVYLTKNGEGDLVVMDIESFEKQKKMLALKEKLLQVRLAQAAGAPSYTVEEVSDYLDAILNEE